MRPRIGVSRLPMLEGLLAIDVGNTHIKLGLRQDGVWTHEWRMSTDVRRTADEYRLPLKGLLAEAGRDGVDTVVLASVVPLLTPAFLRVAETLAAQRVLEVVPPGYGLRVRYHPPDSLGADRFVNAVAAWTMLHRSLVVVDVGTTVTVDAVSDQGEFLGGAIAPGPHFMAQALAQGTARLPLIPPVIPDLLIGTTTAEAIQMGVGQSLAGTVDRLVRRLWRFLGQETPVVLTGGWAQRLRPQLDFPVYLEPRLTLDGLAACADWMRAAAGPWREGHSS
jgi:type III pantothenate kinase